MLGYFFSSRNSKSQVNDNEINECRTFIKCEQLIESFKGCTIISDKKHILDKILALSKSEQLDVGAIILSELIAFLIDNNRVDDEIRYIILEITLNVIKVHDGPFDIDCLIKFAPTIKNMIGYQFAEILIKNIKFFNLILSLIEENDFRLRWTALKVLITFLCYKPDSIQKNFISQRSAIPRILGLLDDISDMIKINAIFIVKMISTNNNQIKKIVVFDGVYEKLLTIIENEDYFNGGHIVNSCLDLLIIILNDCHQNQMIFFDNGFMSMIVKFFELIELENYNSPIFHSILNILYTLLHPLNNTKLVNKYQSFLMTNGILKKLLLHLVNFTEYNLISIKIAKCVGLICFRNKQTIELTFELFSSFGSNKPGNINMWLFGKIFDQKMAENYRFSFLFILKCISFKQLPLFNYCISEDCFNDSKNNLTSVFIKRLASIMTLDDDLSIMIACHLLEMIFCQAKKCADIQEMSIILIEHSLIGNLLKNFPTQTTFRRTTTLQFFIVLIQKSTLFLQKILSSQSFVIELIETALDDSDSSDPNVSSLASIILLQINNFLTFQPDFNSELDSLIKKHTSTIQLYNNLNRLMNSQQYVDASRSSWDLIEIGSKSPLKDFIHFSYYFIELLKNISIQIGSKINDFSPLLDYDYCPLNFKEEILNLSNLIANQQNYIKHKKEKYKTLKNSYKDLNENLEKLTKENEHLLTIVNERQQNPTIESPTLNLSHQSTNNLHSNQNNLDTTSDNDKSIDLNEKNTFNLLENTNLFNDINKNTTVNYLPIDIQSNQIDNRLLSTYFIGKMRFKSVVDHQNSTFSSPNYQSQQTQSISFYNPNDFC